MFNEVSKKGQMDLVSRYWYENTNRVAVRYLNSGLMGHTTSDDILKSLKSALNPTDIRKIIQISIDGLSVNWKFLELHNNEHREIYQKTLLSLGSCGLHVLHESFQTGHSGAEWNINTILRSMYNLFKQSPARKADFSVSNPNSKFPKKICQTRWNENVDVCKCAIEVYNSMKEYLVKTEKLPGTKTVDTLKTAVKDLLTVPKIMFFPSVASLAEMYLRKFQSLKPMMPFLYRELVQVFHSLYPWFLKQEVIEDANTSSELLKLDPKDPKIWCDNDKVDIGVGANDEQG